MKIILLHGRLVGPITTEEGLKAYYNHLNYWRVCYQNCNPLIVPSPEDAAEYIKLKAEKVNFYFCNDSESRIKCHKFDLYETRYDWRPQKSGNQMSVGLVSPAGEKLLPDSFADVFTQFDAINCLPCFIPVSNGEGWALVSLSQPHILATDFRYNAIIPERWERKIFFVQDKTTLKWGALRVVYPFLNRKHYKYCLPLLETLMPPIADAVYEDELLTEEAPTTFFMTSLGDKIGILTDFGHSEIIYDSYEADNDKCTFRLIRHDRKRAKRADFWHPDGKGILSRSCHRT